MGSKRGFDEALCGCFDNIPSCLAASFLPFGICIIHSCAVRRATGKSWVVPCILDLTLGVIGGAINRAEIRAAYDIEGDFITDLCVYCWCAPCAILQEHRQTLRMSKKVT
jgi:Cys-rich protein (TIGR01571 family)